MHPDSHQPLMIYQTSKTRNGIGTATCGRKESNGDAYTCGKGRNACRHKRGIATSK